MARKARSKKQNQDSAGLSAPIPVRYHDETIQEIATARQKTRLTEQEVIRQATRLGLPALIAALGVEATGKN